MDAKQSPTVVKAISEKQRKETAASVTTVPSSQ